MKKLLLLIKKALLELRLYYINYKAAKCSSDIAALNGDVKRIHDEIKTLTPEQKKELSKVMSMDENEFADFERKAFNNNIRQRLKYFSRHGRFPNGWKLFTGAFVLVLLLPSCNNEYDTTPKTNSNSRTYNTVLYKCGDLGIAYHRIWEFGQYSLAIRDSPDQPNESLETFRGEWENDSVFLLNRAFVLDTVLENTEKERLCNRIVIESKNSIRLDYWGGAVPYHTIERFYNPTWR